MPSAFTALPLSPTLVSVLEEVGYSEPTPIQSASLPILLEGHDLLGQSKTGSGKTAAFGLPILQRIELQERAPQALVLCPTRELATQVARELRKLGRRHSGLEVRTLSGGEAMRDQLNALRRGVHLLVGTPGRVLDHLRRGRLNLETLRTVVLDEADRMLEMGFEKDIEEIISATPSSRQTVLFSATFPDSIAKMSRRYQEDARRVRIEEEAGASGIRQLILRASGEEKLEALSRALQQLDYESALVFCNFKKSVAKLENALHLAGASVGCLHGDLEQYERDEAMALFRSQSVRILIATDVAARGIDVKGLDLVVNFEFPNQSEIYTHRIGRTGRAGREGVALSIVDEREEVRLKEAASSTLIRASEEMGNQSPEAPSAQNLTRAPIMQTLKISGGRKDKVRPGDILGALTGEAGGLAGSDIGKIEIQDRRAYVAVKSALIQSAFKSLSNGKIKGRRFKISQIK